MIPPTPSPSVVSHSYYGISFVHTSKYYIHHLLITTKQQKYKLMANTYEINHLFNPCSIVFLFIRCHMVWFLPHCHHIQLFDYKHLTQYYHSYFKSSMNTSLVVLVALTYQLRRLKCYHGSTPEMSLVDLKNEDLIRFCPAQPKFQLSWT